MRIDRDEMKIESELRAIEKTVFPNGLVVITQAMPQVRSVSIGVWIRSGSRREPAEINGISHFIEHMVFKGTEHRSAEQIAREMDRVGGMLDAFTSKEMVCFNAKVLDEHLPLAFDVLADLALSPKFAEEDIVREKSVILEEIKMTEDNPEDLVHELFTQHFWNAHPLGRPILGTPKTVEKFDSDLLRTWFRRWYAPNKIVITAAGSLTHQQIVDLVGAKFAHLAAVEDGQTESVPTPCPQILSRSKRGLEQVHICLGVSAFPMADQRRYAVTLLTNILGGGMSSRLFQNIREKQGLAYAVFSDMNPYRDAGLLSVYAGTALETAEKLIHSVAAEFRDLKENLVTEEELRRSKDHLKGSLLLSLESTGARMSNIARQHLYFDRFFSSDEIIASLEAVTREEIQQIAREFFHPGKLAATVLGTLNGFSVTPEHLAC
jgi:predicted Zn-dependent peptidase